MSEPKIDPLRDKTLINLGAFKRLFLNFGRFPQILFDFFHILVDFHQILVEISGPFEGESFDFRSFGTPFQRQTYEFVPL